MGDDYLGIVRKHLSNLARARLFVLFSESFGVVDFPMRSMHTKTLGSGPEFERLVFGEHLEIFMQFRK